MTNDQLDYLEKQTNLLLRKLTQALAERDEPDDDDGDGDQGQDRWDDMAPDDDNDADAEPDDDEDDQEDFSKSEAALQQENNANTRPGARASSAHYSPGLTLKPAVRTADRHKFDSRVEFVQNRDKVTGQTALSRARLEFPADFEDYQRFNADSSAQEQYARRGGWGSNVGKSAPTFETLIGSEMRKGVTEEIAKQRIINRYGNTAMRDSHFAKRCGSDDDQTTLFAKAEDVWLDGNLDRCSALRQTRLSNPALYKRLV